MLGVVQDPLAAQVVEDGGDTLREQHATAVRHERERREPAALAPFGGDGQDGDDGQDDRHRDADREGELARDDLLPRRPGDDGTAGEQGGEADAGLVYVTDAKSSTDVETAATACADAVVNTYPIVALTGSKNPDAAAAFVAYVLSDDGQSVLRSLGFGAH